MNAIFRMCFSPKGGAGLLRNVGGFSLVELMVVVAIIGILAGIATPLVLSWLPDIRLRGAARDLYGVVMKAKGEAAKRNSNCTLVFNQTIGATTFAYVLFEDNGTLPNRDAEYDPGEPILVQQAQWPQGVSLDLAQGGGDGLTFLVNADGNPAIVFRPTAIPTDNNRGLASGTAFLISTNLRTRNVVVNQAGNVRITN